MKEASHYLKLGRNVQCKVCPNNCLLTPGDRSHCRNRINRDGTAEELGPRNLSHRTQPSLASDGRVIFTQWDHLGGENSGHLMFVNQDMQELREGFESGVDWSYLRARGAAAGHPVRLFLRTHFMTFHKVIGEFSKHFRCVLMDMVNFGGRTKPSTGITD